MSETTSAPVAPAPAAAPVAPVVVPPAAVTPAAAPEVTLAEWCARRSKTDKQVELLGAFHSEAISTGLLKGAPAKFEAAYLAFAKRPSV